MISLLFLSSAAEAQPVPLFSATYKVSYSLLRGEMTLELRKENDSTYIYDTSLTPRGIVSVFRQGSILLKPGDDAYSTPVRYSNDPLLAGFIGEQRLNEMRGQPAVAAAVMAGVMWLLRGLSWLLLIPVGGGVYLAVLALIGGFRQPDMHLLRGVLPLGRLREMIPGLRS